MKIIVAGSRTITSMYDIEEAIRRSGFHITEVVCGMARGADLLGKKWAEDRSISVKEFPAPWDSHKKAAGSIRNGWMADYADALIAVWDGKSAGTRNMIQQMKKRNKPYFVYKINDNDNGDFLSLFGF